MAVRIEVFYAKTIHGTAKLADSLKYFVDVERSIPDNFPGLTSFKRVGENIYDWVFQKFSYSGFDFEIKFQTKFIFSDSGAELVPHEPKGTELSGLWKFSEKDAGTLLSFSAKFVTELGVPSIFKSMATGLVQKELTKLFDRYSDNVAKVLSQ